VKEEDPATEAAAAKDGGLTDQGMAAKLRKEKANEEENKNDPSK
jgi:hypothetical protein